MGQAFTFEVVAWRQRQWDSDEVSLRARRSGVCSEWIACGGCNDSDEHVVGLLAIKRRRNLGTDFASRARSVLNLGGSKRYCYDNQLIGYAIGVE